MCVLLSLENLLWAKQLDGDPREVDRKKILHYRQLYFNRPDPIAFLPAAVDLC